MMELLSVVERLAALDHSVVTYDPKRCLHARDKFISCEACLGICPVEAIQPGEPPNFNPDACAGCLACLPLCPVGAFDADDAVRNLLNCTSHLESNQLELVCQANPHAGCGVSGEAVGISVRGCLAGLGGGAYVALAAMGLEQISVRLDACSECPWGSLQMQVESQVEEARYLLAAWGKSNMVQALSELDGDFQRPLWEAQNPPLSRRDLFIMLSNQGKTALARTIEKEGVPAGKQAGRGHRRLANAMAHLPEPDTGKDLSLEEFSFGMVEVSETCTACGSCARICPTGALTFETNETKDAFTLSFIPQRCIGCQACLHACADSAIMLDLAPSLEKVLEAEEPLVLRSGELSCCEHCHALFAARPGDRLCPLCAFRQQNPLGSRLPKGFHFPGVKQP